ncbi:MAG: cell division protein FtsQ/DivIB [Rhodobacteraceae bacterium]|nr:cell division protein FtsQ/DivIB [Paracoccaceae bacterium]
MTLVAERRDMVVAHDFTPVVVKPKPKELVQSKLGYKWDRLWLTHWFRALVQVWMPIFALLLAVYGGWKSPAVSGWVVAQYHSVRDAVAARPELRVERVEIPVGSPDLQRQILGIMALALPVSVLDADLAGLRTTVEGLAAVKSASVRFEQGALEVTIVERLPAMVWRNLNRIYLVDEDGVRVAEVPRRMVRADLPLLVGEGADKAMLEALEIFSVVAPLGRRVLGLVRMGERRWDVVLKGNVIMLPAENGPDAMRRIMVMQGANAVLDRDVSIIDMRDENRMILRLNEDALIALRAARARLNGEGV